MKWHDVVIDFISIMKKGGVFFDNVTQEGGVANYSKDFIKSFKFYKLVSYRNKFILCTYGDIIYNARNHGQVWGCQLCIILILMLCLGSHMRNQIKKTKEENLFKGK